MFLPVLTICTMMGTPEVQCLTTYGPVTQTEEQCQVDIMLVGVPSMLSRHPHANVVAMECYDISGKDTPT